jgi:hypothetical protein
MGFTSYKKDKLLMENWRKFLKEEAEPQSPSGEGSGMSITDQTSFTTLSNPEVGVKFMQELLKGGDLFKQLQTAQLGKWYTTDTVARLKAWVAGLGGGDLAKGIKIFAERASVIGKKIPSSGIPKKDMPFLPGPDDAKGNVADVADALTPGGKMNVDLFEKIAPPPTNAFVGLDSPEAKAFMTAGANDGIPEDDKIEIKLGGSIAASAAIPTQSNILIPKGLGMAIKDISGGDLGAYGGTDGEILDGHHRWSATMLNDPSANIGTIAQIDLKALGIPETLKYLTTIGNALGNKTQIK